MLRFVQTAVNLWLDAVSTLAKAKAKMALPKPKPYTPRIMPTLPPGMATDDNPIATLSEVAAILFGDDYDV